MRPALAALVLVSASLTTASHAAESRPNFIIILADDLGINDLGCYGRRDQPTPNLDHLASQGLRFTSAYCAQPICSPSRAAILTGKTPARLHLTTFLPGRPDAPSQKLLHPKINQQLPLKEKTLAELLKPVGYVSACIGKWHLGGKGFGPLEQGFDVYFPGHANTMPSDIEGGKGEYELTAKAEEFVTANKDRPFFLYLCHNTPHVPLAAKARLVEKHNNAFNPIYASMMETLDDCVGRLLAKLDELKLAERTVVIFTSDNGGLHVLESPHTPATHNTPFRAGKGYLYEGGLRIPLLVRWPGKIKPGVVDVPVTNTDWPPTLLELAGVEVEGHPNRAMDGVSLAPLLVEGSKLGPRPFYWHFPHYTNQGSRPAAAIRDGDWKLIEHYEDGRVEVFNLAKDISEEHDVSPHEPHRVGELRGKLAVWRKSVGAQENAPNPAYDAALATRLYHDIDTSRLPAAKTAAELATKLRDWRAAMDAVVRPARKPRKE